MRALKLVLPAGVVAAGMLICTTASYGTPDYMKKEKKTSCMACHATGVAGAPKLGDKAAWAPRIKQGMDTLVQSALKGKGAMPPKGGNASLSDADVRAAIEFMVSQAK